jgi:hypothetical protein
MSADPYKVFDRTPAETRRAYELFRAAHKAGGLPGAMEVSVCATCGQWARWDSELVSPTTRCYEGKRHVIARVRLRAEAP